LTPSGEERRYTFFQPGTKECHRIWFTLLEKIFAPFLKGDLKVFNPDVDEKGKPKSIDMGAAVDEVTAICQGIGFDRFWTAACTLLHFFKVDHQEYRMVDGGTPAENTGEIYFADKPVELYLAVLKAAGEVYHPFYQDFAKMGVGGIGTNPSPTSSSDQVPTAVNPSQRKPLRDP
jgi:hypothetical protein